MCFTPCLLHPPAATPAAVALVVMCVVTSFVGVTAVNTGVGWCRRCCGLCGMHLVVVVMVGEGEGVGCGCLPSRQCPSCLCMPRH